MAGESSDALIFFGATGALAEPPREYQPGTWGPVDADRLIASSGGWHQPQPASAKRLS